MSQTGVVAWSQTAASNGTADSAVNFAEGMAPNAVNDSARALMASVAKYRDDNAGTLTTGGTSTAYTLSSNQSFSTLAVLNGQSLRVRFSATNGASPTLNVDSLGAKAIQSAAGTAIGTGVLLQDSIWDMTYDSSASAFIVEGGAQVQTGGIADTAVSLAKLAAQADSTVVGNISGSSASPVALTLSGFSTSGTTITAPHPPIGAFSNLSIKVASNTTVTVAADYVSMFDGSSGWQTLAISQTINMGTTGAGALDTGTIAIDTWYAIWAIAKADGTTSAIASTSSSSPTMPSGYTYKARLGWVRTIHASATLYGTWQLGRRAQYIVGLAQTTQNPAITSGVSGSVTSPSYNTVSVSSYVPPTASAIGLLAFSQTSGSMLIAPNGSYGSYNISTGPIPPISLYTGGSNNLVMTHWMMLESTNIYYASASADTGVQCLGWEDNI